MQVVTPGSNADLEVLKFSEIGFTFNWSKVGPRRQFQPTTESNVLSFPSVSEKDLGYYQCEVKKGEKAVLTVYRALYRANSSTCSVEQHLEGKSVLYCACIFTSK